jgi:hypothetical protein
MKDNSTADLFEEGWEDKADRIRLEIKEFYESKGGTKWNEICASHSLFNRVWRKMLKLPTTETRINKKTGIPYEAKLSTPPPKEYRS